MKAGTKRLAKVKKAVGSFEAALAELDETIALAAAMAGMLEARLVRMGEAAAKRQ